MKIERLVCILVCTWIWGCGSSGGGEVTKTGAELPGGGGAGPRLNPTPIVFRSERADAGVGDLYVMAPDGSGVTRLTRGGDFYQPQWSPDGGSIAFRRILESRAGEVGRVPLDGNPPVQLTDGESANLVLRPVNWSPDGQRLAFASRQEGPGLRMSSIAVLGGQRQQILPDLEMTALIWSSVQPSRIAYCQYANERGADLWIADSESSTPTNLTKGQVYSPSFPRWSPDGKQIALTGYALLPDGTLEGMGSHSADGAGAPSSEIFVIDVESEELTRLTFNTWADLQPVWSPDGKSILFESNGDGDYDIWLMPLDAPEQARDLIDDNDVPSEDNEPDWDWGR